MGCPPLLCGQLTISLATIWCHRYPCPWGSLRVTLGPPNTETLISRCPTQPWGVLLHKMGPKLGAWLNSHCIHKRRQTHLRMGCPLLLWGQSTISLQITWCRLCLCLSVSLQTTMVLPNSERHISHYPTRPWGVPLHKLGLKLRATLC